MRDNGGSLSYEGPYDAIEKSIAKSGKPKKAIACTIYPGRQPETAKSLFSRAMSPQNTDVRMSIENLLTIMRETTPEDFIYYLCDEFGFERPNRKLLKDAAREILKEFENINKHLAVISKHLPNIEIQGGKDAGLL
jgi:hypothetical protein